MVWQKLSTNNCVGGEGYKGFYPSYPPTHPITMPPKNNKVGRKIQRRQKNSKQKRGQIFALQWILRSLILRSTRINICIFKKSVKSSVFFTVWIFTMAANLHALLHSPTHFTSKIWQKGLPRTEHNIKFRTSGLTHDVIEHIHGRVFNFLASFLIEYSLLGSVIVGSPG